MCLIIIAFEKCESLGDFLCVAIVKSSLFTFGFLSLLVKESCADFSAFLTSSKSEIPTMRSKAVKHTKARALKVSLVPYYENLRPTLPLS